MKKLLQPILAFLFAALILLGLGGRIFCIRDNQDYELLQPELVSPAAITGLFHEDGRLYVCYGEANWVNVYLEDGTFDWAVASPNARWTSFYLEEGTLILEGNERYIYDAADGTFLRRTELPEVYDDDGAWEGEWQEVPGYACDNYRVYQVAPDGSRTVLIDRPGWYYLTDLGVCVLLALCCGLGWWALEYLDRIRAVATIPRGVRLKTTRARLCCGYMIFKCILQTGFAVADVLLALRGRDISFWLMAVGVHFIATSAVIWNLLDNADAEADERTLLSFWKATDMVTFFLAFLSVILANLLLGNL